MRLFRTFLLFAVLATPGIASAAVWSDYNNYTPFTADPASFYQKSVSLDPGDYLFTLDFETKGTWDGEGALEDKLSINIITDTGWFMTVLANLSGAKSYTESLTFSTNGMAMIGINADSSGADEKWNFVSASISPTPLPAAAILFGSGLVALVGIRKRFNA